jgi:protoporphyrinogen/coproporphyrinogen III oxidase
MKQIHVGIIGGGLTGLSLAYALKKKGIYAEVFEQSHRMGGVIASIKDDEFLYECGPNTGVIQNEYIELLLQDLQADCTTEIANKQAKKTSYSKK